MSSVATGRVGEAGRGRGVHLLLRICDTIDTINESVGRFLSFAFIAIMLIQVMEATLRYVFRSPTIWAWDVNGQLFTAAAVLGGGYALLHRTHVNLDIVYGRVNSRAKVVFDLITFPLMLFVLVVVIWQGGDMAQHAWETQQRGRSFWAPLLWPVKSTIFIGALLLFFQAISNYIRTFLSHAGILGSEESPIATGQQERAK